MSKEIKITTHEATFDGTLTNTFEFRDDEMSKAHAKFEELENSNTFTGEVDITLTTEHRIIKTVRI